MTQIEEQFHAMKGELGTRPLYVWTPEHIEAHLLISLIILRIIRKQILTSGQMTVPEDRYRITGLSGKRIQEALNRRKVDKLPGDLYRFTDIDDPGLTMILKAFHVDIPLKLYRRAELKSIKTSIDVFHAGA